jgi:hypothetical protein
MTELRVIANEARLQTAAKSLLDVLECIRPA